MWRSRKFIFITSLLIVVLAGSIGGIALAADGEEDSPPAPRHEAMLERVCEIYNDANPEAPIDSEALQEAFSAAQDELRAEAKAKMAEAREAFRQKLIDEGKITQEQLDQWDEWLESMPDVQIPFGFEGHGDMKSFGGHRGFGGGFNGPFGPPCEPETTEE